VHESVPIEQVQAELEAVGAGVAVLDVAQPAA
jgi:hypothetical protein